MTTKIFLQFYFWKKKQLRFSNLSDSLVLKSMPTTKLWVDRKRKQLRVWKIWSINVFHAQSIKSDAHFIPYWQLLCQLCGEFGRKMLACKHVSKIVQHTLQHMSVSINAQEHQDKKKNTQIRKIKEDWEGCPNPSLDPPPSKDHYSGN